MGGANTVFSKTGGWARRADGPAPKHLHAFFLTIIPFYQMFFITPCKIALRGRTGCRNARIGKEANDRSKPPCGSVGTAEMRDAGCKERSDGGGSGWRAYARVRIIGEWPQGV